MIINKYVYTQEEYLKNSKSSLEDICLDRSILSEVPNVKCNLLELFNKHYDKDYIWFLYSLSKRNTWGLH